MLMFITQSIYIRFALYASSINNQFPHTYKHTHMRLFEQLKFSKIYPYDLYCFIIRWTIRLLQKLICILEASWNFLKSSINANIALKHILENFIWNTRFRGTISHLCRVAAKYKKKKLPDFSSWINGEKEKEIHILRKIIHAYVKVMRINITFCIYFRL